MTVNIADLPETAPHLHLASAHGATLETVAEALTATPGEDKAFIADYIELTLATSTAGKLWRNLMALHPDVFQGPTMRGMIDKAVAEGQAKGQIEGKIEGKIDFLLTTIGLRGIELAEAQADRVKSCTDEQVLEQWLRRVFEATTAEEIFAD